MLFKPQDIISEFGTQESKDVSSSFDFPEGRFSFSGDADKKLHDSLGEIIPGNNKVFWSFGTFNIIRLIIYCLQFTGAAHVFLSSYSISEKTMRQIINKRDNKEILSIKFLIDHRVKTNAPKPLQLLSQNFEFRFVPIHAKVALIYNDDFQLSIITSQNATDNSKIETGCIFTNKSVFEFNKLMMDYAFDTGTIE
jgi:hypothetical protein